MTKRITNTDVQVEYQPTPHVRTSTIGAQVEYLPDDAALVSSVGLQIEYIEASDFKKISMVALQVEYAAIIPTSPFGPAVQIF
jgi:hypothetical protein